jgi:3-hexulose-6-phosphate synthase/6-phospho-3-hexuloisomerase
MNVVKNSNKIINAISNSLKGVSDKKSSQFIEKIIKAKRIFIFGAGRSGLAGQAFAMRLVHLGKSVYFVGECTTPSIASDDLLVLVSGSGSTKSVIQIAQAAKKQRAKIVCIATDLKSKIAKLSDLAVKIPYKNKRKGNDYFARQLKSEISEVTPMGTLFELSAMIYFDSIVLILMDNLQKSEEDMRKVHSNLE